MKHIEIALGEIGYLEKKSNDKLDLKTANPGNGNYNKYARDLKPLAPEIYVNGVAWCDIFVDWCFVKAYGAEKAKKILHDWSAYTPTSASYYKQKNEWFKSPKIGDQIFFKDKNGTICHTGLVYNVDKNYVYTVEGNTSSESGVVSNGGAVAKKKYALNYKYIAGYGRPNIPKDYVSTPVEAVKKLNDVGIINSPDVWYAGTWTDDNFKSLLTKCAAYISKKEIAAPSDAIDVLNKAGIINSPEIWYNGTWTDDNFKSLLIKIANYVR